MHALCLLAAMAGASGDYGKQELDGRIYYLHVPARRTARLALFVWLHPASGTAAPQFTWWLRSGIFSRDTVLLCPQAKGMGWVRRDDETFLAKVIEHVSGEHSVDPSRRVLGGHSSGAGFTWYYGLSRQEEFAAIIPAAGPWRPGMAPDRKEKAPSVYIYHSRDDDVFPFEQAVEARDALKAKGYTVSLTEDTRKHGLGPKLYVLLRKVFRDAARRKAPEKQPPPGKS